MSQTIAILALLLPGACLAGEPATAPAAPEPPRTPAVELAAQRVKLPHLEINFQERCVDLEATVCLDEGFLELVACTKQSKEHESIVAIASRPMHIHAALLALGAQQGNPALMRPVDEARTRWVPIPPRGGLVDVFLVFKDSKGKMMEHPISKFVTRADNRRDELFAPDDGGEGGGQEVAAKPVKKFPDTFLFAGSQLRDNGKGPRTYLADESGDVISIASFGDELLCLPGRHENANDALMWQVDSTHLPDVGSQVTLRLRPRLPAGG